MNQANLVAISQQSRQCCVLIKMAGMLLCNFGIAPLHCITTVTQLIRLKFLYWEERGVGEKDWLIVGNHQYFLLTPSRYPKSYQEEFIRDLFYAANAFQDYLKVVEEKHLYQLTPTTSALPIPPVGLRPRLSLEEEQYLNEGAECRIIGLTLETRPDHISKGELRRLRRFGCTRVQIGIQHTNDEILEGINRGCTQNDAVRAIRLLKDGCFKVNEW